MVKNNKKVNDPMIRELVLRRIKASGLLSTHIVQELGVDRGKAVADIVGLFKVPHCYEIKSEVDSLKRLERQVQIFGKVFPKISLVTVEKHLAKAIDMIPEWWGILLVKHTKISSKLITHRKPLNNPNFRKEQHLKLLWNDSLKNELSARSIPYKSSHNRDNLSKLLASKTLKKEVFDITREHLSSRYERYDKVIYTPNK